jgi:hypothetical protein
MIHPPLGESLAQLGYGCTSPLRGGGGVALQLRFVRAGEFLGFLRDFFELGARGLQVLFYVGLFAAHERLQRARQLVGFGSHVECLGANRSVMLRGRGREFRV